MVGGLTRRAGETPQSEPKNGIARPHVRTGRASSTGGSKQAMSVLTIHYSDGRTVPVDITKNDMLIGRDATCDIPLDDAITSRNHARFGRDESGQFWIQDLQSKNGTTVNDRGVTRSHVREGDRIGIGGCFLTLTSDPTPAGVVLSEEPETQDTATTSAWSASHRIILPQQRLERLYELNERLTGRFDRDDLLAEVLQIGVESLRFERAGIAVWRGPPHPPDWVSWKNMRTDPSGELRISRSLVDRALHNAERILVKDTAAEMPDPTASIISNNIKSAMCVPMVYHDRVQGVMYGDRVTSTGGYTREDTDFFAALGRLGAMGLANVQLADEMKRRQQVELQLEWARQIQQGLFPRIPLGIPGVQIAALNDPGQQVSGDYYDYFTRSDGLVTIVMADVMGKGIPAALLMANLQAAAHLLLETETDLTVAVGQLNRLICRNVSDSRFITALFGLLDPAAGTFAYVNAGHMPPYRLEPGGKVTELTMDAALPLGVEENYAYKEGVFELRDRPTTLFLYTDGVPDAQNVDDERFETARFVELLESNTDRPPDEMVDRIRKSIKQFTRNHVQTDDITMLAIRLD